MGLGIDALMTLAEGITATADERLSSAGSPGEIASAMTELSERVERELARNRQPKKEGVRLACRPGCGSCCVVNVSVLIPEAVAIAHYLKSALSPVKLLRLKPRIDQISERVRWVDDDERPRLKQPCAFLDEKSRCIIHPARPLLCRSISSNDPEACRDAIASPEEERSLLMDLHQKILCTLVFTQLGFKLMERGKDSRSLELTRLVRNFLDTPSLIDDFVAGRRLSFH